MGTSHELDAYPGLGERDMYAQLSAGMLQTTPGDFDAVDKNFATNPEKCAEMYHDKGWLNLGQMLTPEGLSTARSHCDSVLASAQLDEHWLIDLHKEHGTCGDFMLSLCCHPRVHRLVAAVTGNTYSLA